MGYKTSKSPTVNFDRHKFVLFDEFLSYNDADLWTKAVAGTGTVTHEGPGRSNARLFSTADNDAAVLATTNELFKFVAGKEIYGECRINFTDPNTNQGGVAFGFADAMAATLLGDNGGAIVIPNDGAVIYKPELSLLWSFATEIGGVNVTTISSSAAGGGVTQRLGISIIPRSATVFECRPFVDGVQMRDANGVRIKHDVTLGTATDMDFGAVVKGFHADDMIVLVDYVYASQVR